jgi:hypothetical protein
VPFVKRHFMGPVVFLMVMTAPLLTATVVSTALLLQQSRAPQVTSITGSTAANIKLHS